MRDSAIFYRSFYEAIKELPPQNQSEVYTAVFEYALNFKTVNLNGLSKTIFTLIKPQLDANIKRFKNGSKAKIKQSRSKPETNNNVNNKDNVNTNNNLNLKENNKDNKNSEPSHSFSFTDFWELYNKKTGLTFCQQVWEELTEADKILIKERLPAYIKATENEITFRKDPYTWLMGKHWLDEHIPAATKKSPVKSAFELLVETGKYQ